MSQRETLSVLSTRVAELDAPTSPTDLERGVPPEMVRFIRTIQPVTKSTLRGLTAIEADAADEVIQTSKLLARIGEKAPELVGGPLSRTTQYWVSAERPEHRPPRRALHRDQFIAAEYAPVTASTKPFDVGLFSSTGALETFGMWWCLLQVNKGSTLFPTPWHVWALSVPPEARLLEIASATAWTDFVMSDPVCGENVLYPNWRTASNRYDGVHMTLNAVAATQGIRFAASGAVVAPPYWDIESTLWLRWVFTGVGLVDGTT